ncbi:hypothetical protein EGH21_06085 [Halomicroarcula sp. F13]|uniref:Ribbon-helix-helix CopG family protein n=1 Tax=Haloarcula rubra TaxID=2487747 RepID=A0AAW4PNC2_9EURY|nr:hypothetical protein [Halomicroarcula rubra]MBX0322594.1 hypothetical protein [Halomicroarcula rubra]
MTDRQQINVRLDPEQKERWERYAEEDKRVSGGISGLVRTAVEAFIDPEQSQSASSSESVDIPDDLSDRLATIEDTVQDVQTTVERTDESVGYIEQELFGSDDRPFSDQLIRAIPPARPHSETWEGDKQQYEDTRWGEPVIWEGTVDAFVEQLDVDRGTVEQSLKALTMQQDSFVETGTVDEVRRYWSDRELEFQPYADGRNVDEEQKRRKFRNRQESRE